jgi:hypothetical protein
MPERHLSHARLFGRHQPNTKSQLARSNFCFSLFLF